MIEGLYAYLSSVSRPATDAERVRDQTEDVLTGAQIVVVEFGRSARWYLPMIEEGRLRRSVWKPGLA